MKIDDIRQGLDSLFGTVSEGWDRVRHSAAGALTRFKPGEQTRLPESAQIDDAFYLTSHGWAMLGGDLYEDDQRLVVRIEAPGMDKEDFEVEVLDDTLLVRGEKRFERESTEAAAGGAEGRWRVLQCAYGRFERKMPLPVAVKGEAAQASYRNGVLRIELPKATPARPRTVNVPVA